MWLSYKEKSSGQGNLILIKGDTGQRIFKGTVEYSPILEE